jgi:hypothetical protein
VTAGSTKSPRSPTPGSTVVLAAATVAVLLLLAPMVFDAHSVTSIDSAVKAAQATELVRSGFSSMALSYPGRALDPAEYFFPFESPFVFLSAGSWQSIFSSVYAVVAAWPLYLGGLAGLVALSMLGGCVTVLAAAKLPEATPGAAMLALVATPIWLYSLTPGETALALGFVTAAMAAAARLRGRSGDWTAGLLLGVAALFRDESLLMAPGLLYARHLAGQHLRRDLPRAVVAIGVPIALMGVIDQWWFDRPMLAHLRHAVPGFDALLPRARAQLPELEVMGWHERLVTVVEYWLVGFSVKVAAVVAMCVALAHVGRRAGPIAVAITMTAAMALHVADLVVLFREPRILAGLFRLSPFLILALLPKAGGEPASRVLKLTWVTAACYLAVVAVTVNTEGGKPTGPRLIIGLWPLLAVSAVDVLRSYLEAARRSRTAMVTAAAGLVLVLGSLVMEGAVVVPARIGRRDDNAVAARTVRAIGDRVVVVDSIFEVEILTSLHFDRAVMRVHRWQLADFTRTMMAQGVDRFTLVARPPGFLGAFPGYRNAETWTPGRHVISRWVRDPPAAR